MIPVIQFDPASLSLWYDAHLIAKCRGADEIREAIELAYEGRDDELRDHVEQIHDPRVKVRAAHLASSVWHEKRHFLDFLLTNYGALRVRQFFEIYQNLPVLFNQTDGSKRILLPLESNLDPVKRDVFGIGDVSPSILQFAEGIEKRKWMLAEDRRSIPFYDGKLVEFGGEAIMEAIAYHVQTAKAHRVFGREIAEGVQRDQPPGEAIGNKYRWAYELLSKIGLMSAVFHGHNVFLGDEPYLPLLYGALAGRFWKQEQTRTASTSSYLPAERLSSFIVTLQESTPNFKDLKVLEAWDAVNATAKKIFGRSVLEEMEADIAFEQKYIEMMTKIAEEDEPPLIAYRDYHALRISMFENLKSDPASVISQPHYSDSMVSRLRPKVVVAASAGEIGLPPKGFESLISYAHPEIDYEQVPEARWWWASTRSPRRQADDNRIELRAHKAWCAVISDYAPLAKLVAAGLRCRVMLGPELISIKRRVEHAHGIQFIIDGLYAPELNGNDIDFWYYITGNDRLRCELSFDDIENPDGWMLDPWELRLRPRLNDALTASMEGASELIRLTMWRDWSPWILGNKGRSLFEKFPRESRALELHLGAITG